MLTKTKNDILFGCRCGVLLKKGIEGKKFAIIQNSCCANPFAVVTAQSLESAVKIVADRLQAKGFDDIEIEGDAVYFSASFEAYDGNDKTRSLWPKSQIHERDGMKWSTHYYHIESIEKYEF